MRLYELLLFAIHVYIRKYNVQKILFGENPYFGIFFFFLSYDEVLCKF